MIRSRVLSVIVFGSAVAACQHAPEPAAQPSPNAPAAQATLAPAPPVAPGAQALDGTAPEGSAPALSPIEPAAPEAMSARRPAPRTSTRTRTAQAPRRTPVAPSRDSGRVDRLPPAEPIDIPMDDTRGRAPEPTRAREASRERVVLPAGTELQLVLEEGLSSATAQEGDPVTARVSRATGPDGSVLLPGGTVLRGRVYRADAAGRVKGRARLSVDFDRIVIRGAEQRLDTTAIDVEGPDSHGRDAAIIGGSTVGGAIVGGILGGGSGAKKGAVVGAVGGTGAVLATRGKDVNIPAGSRWTVRVKDRVTVN